MRNKTIRVYYKKKKAAEANKVGCLGEAEIKIKKMFKCIREMFLLRRQGELLAYIYCNSIVLQKYFPAFLSKNKLGWENNKKGFMIVFIRI